MYPPNPRSSVPTEPMSLPLWFIPRSECLPFWFLGGILISDSNDAFDLLGEIIVIVNGTSSAVNLSILIKGNNKTYEEIIQDHILTPMGLNYTTFSPDKELREDAVVSHTDIPGDSGVVDIDLGFMNPYLPSSTPSHFPSTIPSILS